MQKKLLLLILPLLLVTGCSAKTHPETKGQINNNQTIKSKSKSQVRDKHKKPETVKNHKQEEKSKEDKEEKIQKISKSEEVTKPNPPIDEKTLEKIRINNSQADPQTKYILGVSQQYQSEWNWCAPTTVSMLLAYKGISVSQAQLAKEMATNQSFGTHNVNAIKVLNKHLFGYESPQSGQAGYRLAEVKDASLGSEDMRLFKERLVQNIKDDFPMYYTFDVSKIYPGKNGEHNVIGIGYQLSKDGKDVEYIYYLDPSYAVIDSTYGGLKKVRPEELLQAMLTCVEPNYAW